MITLIKNQRVYFDDPMFMKKRSAFFYQMIENPVQPNLCLCSTGIDGVGWFSVHELSSLSIEPIYLEKAKEIKKEIDHLQKQLNDLIESDKTLTEYL